MWKVLNEVIGRSPSEKTVINELNGPNGTAKEEFDIVKTRIDIFPTVGELLNANTHLLNNNTYMQHVSFRG